MDAVRRKYAVYPNECGIEAVNGYARMVDMTWRIAIEEIEPIEKVKITRIQ